MKKLTNKQDALKKFHRLNDLCNTVIYARKLYESDINKCEINSLLYDIMVNKITSIGIMLCPLIDELFDLEALIESFPAK